MSRISRMRAPVLAGAGGLIACGYVYAMDPSEPGHYPPCPMKTFTGLDCPLCGSLRSTHEAMHGNFGTAVDYNLMTVFIVLPVAMVLLLAWSVQRWRGRPFEVSVPRWANAAIVGAVLGFTVIRNLPGMWWSSTV